VRDNGPCRAVALAQAGRRKQAARFRSRRLGPCARPSRSFESAKSRNRSGAFGRAIRSVSTLRGPVSTSESGKAGQVNQPGSKSWPESIPRTPANFCIWVTPLFVIPNEGHVALQCREDCACEQGGHIQSPECERHEYPWSSVAATNLATDKPFGAPLAPFLCPRCRHISCFATIEPFAKRRVAQAVSHKRLTVLEPCFRRLGACLPPASAGGSGPPTSVPSMLQHGFSNWL